MAGNKHYPAKFSIGKVCLDSKAKEEIFNFFTTAK
jgi:hypothetical protein